MAISHKDHDHPNTPGARAACRKAMQINAEGGFTAVQKRIVDQTVKAAQMTVVPRRRGDGGVVKGMQAHGPTLKRENAKIKGIRDLADMPQMLAYAVRLAWAADLEVVAGHPFNDTEANVIIKGPAAHITLMWKVARPNGISKMRIRPVDSSVCAGDATSAQQAVDIALGVEPIPNR